MSKTEFHFHWFDVKYFYGLLISLIAGLFIFIAALALLQSLHIESAIIPASIVLAFLYVSSIAYYSVQMFRSSRQAAQQVQIDASGLHCSGHAYIAFNQIASYRISQFFSNFQTHAPAPSFFLYLHGGGKIRFDLNAKYYHEEIESYLAFIDNCIEAIRADKQARQSPHTRTPTSVSDYQEAKKGLILAKKRRLNKYTIPVGFILGVLFVARACAPEIADHFHHNPLRDFKQTTDERFDNEIRYLRNAINRQGEVYLYSNDKRAKIELFPNIPAQQQDNTAIPLIQKSHIADNMEYFLLHQDELGFSPMIILPNKTIQQVAWQTDINTKIPQHVLYLTVYDSQNRLGDNDIPALRDLPPLLKRWFVTYRDDAQLKEILNNKDSWIGDYIRLLNNTPGLYIYASASQSDGMTQKDFKQVIQVIKDLLDKAQVDNKSFRVRIHRPPENN